MTFSNMATLQIKISRTGACLLYWRLYFGIKLHDNVASAGMTSNNEPNRLLPFDLMTFSRLDVVEESMKVDRNLFGS